MPKKRRIYLTDRFFLLGALALTLTLVALLFPGFFLFSFLAWPLLFLLAASDRLMLSRQNLFRAEVKLSPNTPELGENLTLTFLFFPQGAYGPLPSKIHMVRPRSKTLIFELLKISLAPQRNDNRIVYRANLSARAAKLGFESLESVDLLSWSPLGLWFHVAPTILVKKLDFRVVPSRKAPPEAAFREAFLNQFLLFQGTRQAMRGQSPEEFYSIRKYQYPDPVRFIDAKKTARYGQLMTRTYDSFFDHHLIIGLDISRSLIGEIEGSQKLDYYLAACLQLAESAFLSRDRVSFFAFSQKIHFLVKRAKHLLPFRHAFEGSPLFQPREEEANFEILLPTLNQLTGQRSLFILFTDISRPSIQQNLERVIPKIATRHLSVVATVQDNNLSVEKQLARLTQSALDTAPYNHLLYSYWLADNLPLFQSRMTRAGAAAVQVPHGRWMAVVERLYQQLRKSSGI